MIRVEHELHQRRKGLNMGVRLLLIAFVAILMGLTMVKVVQLGDAAKFEKFDHVARPQIIPEEGAGE